VKNANLVSRTRAGLFLLAAMSALAACDGAKPAPPAAVKAAGDFFPIRLGAKTVRMQLAVLPAEMEHGLMGRPRLAGDEGMLFVYTRPQGVSFWMRNTPNPLDIGYLNPEGVLEEIYPMFPFDETPVPSRSKRLLFALEMNQGWYRENGVEPGARLDLKALAAALKERGFAPRKFGLPE
jgi:uncharacterized membrane protein (UPF0127 family)